MMMTRLASKQLAAALAACALVAALGAGCSKQARRDRLVERANRDFEAGKYDRAEIEYLSALRIPPPSPAALANLGLIYNLQGKSGAFNLLTNALALDSGNIPARVMLGRMWLSATDFTKAHAEALAVLDKQPTNTEALLLMADSTVNATAGAALQRLGSLPAAVKSTAAYHTALGTIYLRQGDPTSLEPADKAEPEFKQAVALDPKASAAYLGLAEVQRRRKNFPEAEAAFKLAADTAPLRSPVRIAYADWKFKTRAVDEARGYVENITKEAPDYIPAWRFLTRLALDTGDTNACAANLEKLLGRDPGNFEGRLLQGKLQLQQGDVTNAITSFERMAAVVPYSAELQYNLGRAYLFKGDLGNGVAAMNQARIADTNYAEPVLVLAEMDIRRRNAANAIPSLLDLLKRGERMEPALLETTYYLLTWAYTQTDMDMAMASYQRMTQVFSNNVPVHMLMGSALNRAEKKPEARVAFQTAQRLATNSLAPLVQLVSMDVEERKFTNALALVSQAIDSQPTNAFPWFLRGEVLYAKMWIGLRQADESAFTISKLPMDRPGIPEQVKETESALLKALELAPTFQNAYVRLSQLYVEAGKHEEALTRLAAQVERKTNEVVALVRIGTIQNALTNYPAAADAYSLAITNFDQALKSDPGSLRYNFEAVASYPVALNNLAYLYSEKLKDPDKAYQLASKVHQLYPQQSAFTDTLGWVLYRRGEYARAVALLEEGERLDSAGARMPDPEITYHLGMAYYMNGEEQAAEASLTRFLGDSAGAIEKPEAAQRKQEARQKLALLAIDPAKADASARSELEAALGRSAGDPVALCRLAALQARDGAPDKALESLKKVLETSPQNIKAIHSMAELYAGPLKDPAKALESAREARRLAPQDPRIAHTLGRLAFQTRDYTWAYSLLDESARQLRSDTEVAFDLAWSLYSLGRVDEAAQTMRRAAGPGATPSRAAEAKQFLQMVDLSNSAANADLMATQAREILTKQPDYVPAIAVSARAEELRSKFAEAAAAYDRVLALYPQFSPAAMSLARLCYYQLKDEKKGYEMASKARAAFPADAEVAKILGVFSFKRNEFSRAAQLLQESARQLNKDGEVYFYLGMACSKLKQKPEAQRALDSALALNLPPRLAESAKAELKSLRSAP